MVSACVVCADVIDMRGGAGVVVQLSGKVVEPYRPWLHPNVKKQYRLLVTALSGVAGRLGVLEELEGELYRRWKRKKAGDGGVKKVVNCDDLWDFIKRETRYAPSQWAGLVFGEVDVERQRVAQYWADQWYVAQRCERLR